MLKVAIIILNYQNYEDTIKCVNNLLNFTNIQLQIVIVDNFSTNKSFFILNKIYANNSNVDVIQTNNNGGYSSGNNFRYKIYTK